MENSVKRKINIFGKVGKIITTVIIVLLLIAEGGLLTGGVIVAAVPKDSVTVDARVNADVNVNTGIFGFDGGDVYVKAGDMKIIVGNFSTDQVEIKGGDGAVTVSTDVNDLHFDLNSALLLIVCGFLSVAAIVVALFFFKALMREFSACDSPFSDGVVQKMKNFAIALIPCVIVAEGMKKAMGGIISNSITMDFDLVSVGFVIIIFVLTMIFKYGAMLQKEHDETV